jgi:Tfp pilus assembly protein PilF
MNLKMEEYHHAAEDFRKAIQINPNKGFAYIGKATAQI